MIIFVTILKRPGFSHLYLPFYVKGPGIYRWAIESSEYLRRVLSAARYLKDVLFLPTLDPGPLDLLIPLTSIN